MGTPLTRPLPSVGESFGAWTVDGESFVVGKDRRVPVRCDCGTRRDVSWGNLRKGTTTNCGCQRQAWNRSHGESRSALYAIWAGIVQRCTDPKSRIYRYYGGRGIRMCDEWRHDYPAFAVWARAHGWAEGVEIDRADNDGPYSPTNCRIADRATNMRNTRANLVVEAWGESKSVAAWADDDRCLVDYRCALGRIYRGWKPEDAFTRPKRQTSMTRS